MAAPSRLEVQPRLTRVVIADDSYLIRRAVTTVLARADGLELVGSCDTLDSLRAVVQKTHPNVVVSDIRMPPTGTNEGIKFARGLRETDPDIGVVVLSQFAEARYVTELLESGSAGRAYLLKDRIRDADQLIDAIETVAQSGSLIDPAVVDVLVRARARTEGSPLSEVTPRERDVLAEIAAGKSNAAIAQSLSLTKRAVEKHVNSIFAKLMLSNSGEVSPRVTAALMFLAEDAPGND